MTLPVHMRERLRLPVLAAPMFIVSGPDLVIEQCKAGVIGSFPALNARPQEELDRWLTRIETELAQWQREHPQKKVAPYAVNLIVNKANKRLEADFEVVIEAQGADRHHVAERADRLRPAACTSTAASCSTTSSRCATRKRRWRRASTASSRSATARAGTRAR